MEQSKSIIQKAGIVPFLQLAEKLEGGGVKGTGAHKVKIISDKVVKGTDYQTNEERYEVQYLVEENGQKKKYKVPVKDKNGEVHYLVQRLAEIEEGTEIILEYKRRGLKGYIDVQRANLITPEKVATEEIPIIEEDEKIPSDSGEGEALADISF